MTQEVKLDSGTVILDSEKEYTVEITAEDGEIHRIQSAYLIEMQKPSFIADMAAQLAKQ